MNCRDFLSEFEARNTLLSDRATLHLQDCADCRKINVVQTRVWQLIDKFEPVSAPNDFNFYVKSKIANAKPSDFKTVGFPALRYVLGLSVVGLIFAFVIFNGFYSLNDKTVPAIAENSFQPTIQNVNSTAANSPAPELIARTAAPAEFQTPAGEISKPKIETISGKKLSKNPFNSQQMAVKAEKLPPIKASNSIAANSGGSQVLSSRGAQVKLPNGFQAQTIKSSPDSMTVNPTTAEQILSLLGIESVLENGKRKVKKIVSNSVAERSKIQVGDVIEAIDGETLTSEPIRAKTIEGKTLTILRGAEKQEIVLHN